MSSDEHHPDDGFVWPRWVLFVVVIVGGIIAIGGSALLSVLPEDWRFVVELVRGVGTLVSGFAIYVAITHRHARRRSHE